MRRRVLILALVLLLPAAACGDDDDAGDGSPAPADATAAATRIASTPAAGSTPDVPQPGGVPRPADSEVEVTGLAGVVDAAAGTIEITRLSGADVTRVELSASTVIRRGQTGETISLADIRPSDRIIASGLIDEDGAFIASEIEVQPAAATPSG